jgi:hypothetical protein
MTPNTMTRFLLLALACTISLLAGPARAAAEFSAAEQALFVTNHLNALKPSTTLHYRFRKSGSLEPGFEDTAAIALSAQADGKCCAAAAEFLSGPRRLALPEIEAAQGNPVILFFLERDIREMERLTKGKANYFRKRIRVAVADAATIRDVMLPFDGRNVAAREITITPYADDPLRARFEQLINKRYVFTLSDAVPGGVLSIRTQVDAPAAGSPPLLAEEMALDRQAPTVKP